MAKTINLGKVGLTFEGDYDSSKNYASRTCVFYDHVSWASKKDVPAGIAPGSNDEYWQKVSERGAQGIQGERGPQGNSAFDGTGIELVNNLTQGGEASALSAEQGKILKEELTELGTYQENPEFARAYTDADGKFLWGIRCDGTIEWAKGVPAPIKDYIKEIDHTNDTEVERINQLVVNLIKDVKGLTDTYHYVTNEEWAFAILDAEDHVLMGIKADGKIFFSYQESLIKYDDVEERMEMTLDQENKIISYRDREGVYHERKAHVGRLIAESIIYRGQELGAEVCKEEFVYVERPKFGEIRMWGELPTDISDAREATDMLMAFCVNNKEQFRANCKVSIQGHGSATAEKHNWTIDIFNKDMNELAVKFGNMPALDSYHLKGFFSDRTHTRVVGGASFWRDMISMLEYPYGKVNNKPLDISDGQSVDSIYYADARYCEDGFPVALHVNDEFYGLYTIKTKKHRKNYAMQKSIKSEIFLDSCKVGAYLHQPFNYAEWDLKNPKLKNYDEGQEITDADVLASIERLFGFLNNISEEYDNHADYIVLKHWIVFVIFSEIVGNFDINGNNMNLLTWDGSHWSIIPYDLDSSLGLQTWNNNHIQATENPGLVVRNIVFFSNFYDSYKEEIKSLYKKLRESGFLNEDRIYQYYIRQAEGIPREIYELDLEKWKNAWTNGIPTLEQIYAYIHSRISYLDSIWL